MIQIKIIIFINKLLEDVLFELDRGLKKDKEKIGRLLFSLHNLPRVYLDKEAYTLCSLGQEGITVDNALEYSKMILEKVLKKDIKEYKEVKISYDTKKEIWVSTYSFGKEILGGTVNIAIDEKTGEILLVWSGE